MEQQHNIPLSKSTAVECDNCGCTEFYQALHIRKISGILTGDSNDSYTPIPVFACKDCGHVNIEFMPDIQKDDEED